MLNIAQRDDASTLRQKGPFEELDLLQQETSRFQDLFDEYQSLRKILQIPYAKDALPEKESVSLERLKNLQTTAKARKLELISLHERRNTLKKNWSLLSSEIPKGFLESARKDALCQKWLFLHDILKKVLTNDLQSVQKFENAQDFTEFVSHEKERLEEAEKAVFELRSLQGAEKGLQSLLHETEEVSPFLKELYVAPYIDSVEARLGGPLREEILKEITQQKEHLFLLQKTMHDTFQMLKKRAVGTVEQLMLTEINVYKDLPKKHEALLKPEQTLVLPHEPILTQENYQQIVQKIQEQQEKSYQESQSLVSVGRKRNQQLLEIADFQKMVLNSLEKYKRCRDFQDEVKSISEQISHLHLSKNDLLSLDAAHIENAFNDRYSAYLEMKKGMSAQYAQLDLEYKKAQDRISGSKLRLKRRLCEIFSFIFPYPDLFESLKACRHLLNRKLEVLDEQFFHGTISSLEYENLCNDLAYEHDIVLLRNELSFRATRLKELREEVFRLYREMQAHKRYVQIATMASSDAIYKEGAHILAQLKELIKALDDPFRAFAHCLENEQINQTFRSFWLKVEDLQPKVQEWKIFAQNRIAENLQTVKKAISKALDDLEEVIKQEEGARPALVNTFDDVSRESLNDDAIRVFTKIGNLERKYPYIQPFSFFIQVDDFRVRQKMLREAKKLTDRLYASRKFAKTLQQYKTFEEERIDDILEAYEKSFLVEEKGFDESDLLLAWEEYTSHTWRSISLVEEEVLFDIGLLDRKALMDVDPRALEKILHYATLEAYKKTVHPQNGYLHQLEAIELDKIPFSLLRDVYNALVESFKDWARAHPEKDSDDEKESFFWQERLNSFCQNLFRLKCFRAAIQNNINAKCFLLREQLQRAVTLLEHWLQRRRRTEGYNPNELWIPECFQLRYEIERFSTDEDSGSAFLPLIEKTFARIEKIPEVHYAKAEDKALFDHLLIKQELMTQIQEIDAIKNAKQAQEPFFYLPGYLKFFS